MEKELNIEFRKAAEADLDDVFAVVRAAIEEMDRNGIPQWDELYPDREILAEDISKHQLFVAVADGATAGIFVVNEECDEEYKDGKWQYPEASFRVIHRLCVNPEFQNKGIGSLSVRHIERELVREGVESIRLDAFTLNPYALKMYDKLGYVKVGTANLRKGQFWLMEKHL